MLTIYIYILTTFIYNHHHRYYHHYYTVALITTFEPKISEKSEKLAAKKRDKPVNSHTGITGYRDETARQEEERVQMELLGKVEISYPESSRVADRLHAEGKYYWLL